MSGGEQRETIRIVRFGIFEADLATGELRRGDTLVKLQDQPFRLLALLLEHPGSIVTRDELRAALWPDGTIVDFEYGLNTAIKKVRYALGDSADNPRFIQTLPRNGYRFIAPVTPEGQFRPIAAAAVALKSRSTWMTVAALAAFTASGFWLLPLRHAPQPADLPVPLTAYPGLQYAAAFSPDGRQVAFAWNGASEDNFDIYVKTAGSDSLTRITTDPVPDLSPAWSPDGRRIAFLRDLGESRVAIMIAPSAGGFAVKVAETHAPLFEHYRNLAFTPDGNWLITTAGASNLNAGEGLVLFSTENGARRPLTQPSAGYDINPALAPDGRSLAFLRGSHLPAVDLYVLPLDPNWSALGEPRRLTFWNRYALSPAWTADGREVIVALVQYFNTRLWRVPVSGMGKASLITSAGDETLLPALARTAAWLFHRGVSGSASGRWISLCPARQDRVCTVGRVPPAV